MCHIVIKKPRVSVSVGLQLQARHIPAEPHAAAASANPFLHHPIPKAAAFLI